MSDRLQKLPALAFVEAQVLHRAAKAGALAESVSAVEQDYDLPKGSLGKGVFLESRVAALLYCLIVIPSEIWINGPEHAVYQSIDKQWSVNMNVTVSKSDKAFSLNPTYWFVRHLRNAASHANFIIENDRFKFWDRPKRGKPNTFEASLSLAGMESFLEIAGAILANLRNG